MRNIAIYIYLELKLNSCNMFRFLKSDLQKKIKQVCMKHELH